MYRKLKQRLFLAKNFIIISAPFFPSPPGNDQDKLLDAASKVASSMKGLEDEAFKDLASQLEKMNITTEEPAAATQSESLQ